MRKNTYLNLVLLILYATPSLANSEVDFFSLSLKELSEVNIYTASQEMEKASESPSITSVITAEQIKKWGASNLYEAISFLPGVELNETYMGYSVLTFRGVTPGLYNNKALFMINGQPMYERLFGSSHLEYVPLDMVERIEVVRSPASALYGSNAVSGVVNVITKQEGSSLGIRAGSHRHHTISAQHHESNLSIAASSSRDDGFSYTGTDDEFGNPVNFDYDNALDNLFLDYHPEGWRINASYLNLNEAKFGLNPFVFHHGNNRHNAYNISINRHQALGDGTLNIWLRYDSMDKELDAEAFPTPSSNMVTNFNTVTRQSIEIQYKEKLTTQTSFILGVNYEKDESDPLIFTDMVTGNTLNLSPFFTQQEFNNHSLYSQVKHNISADLISIVGLRLEDNSDTGNSGVIPRIGLSYQYSTGNYVKLLYSEAFRTPVFLEKYAQVPGILTGDINLEREKIKTLEISLDSNINSSNKITATAYMLELADEITRRPANDGGTEYFNAEERETYGLEFEWRSVLSNKSRIDINLSYLDGEDSALNSLPFVSSYTANLMYYYQLNDHINISLANQMIGSKDFILTDNTEGEVDGYNLTNLVINYQAKAYELSLTLKNLFDEDYTSPEPVRRNIAEIPGGAGATAYINLNWSY